MTGNGWDYLENITHNPVGGYLKDGRMPVGIDGDDYVRSLHAHQVLNSAADATGNVNLRSNRLAGLTDLTFYRHPASLNDSTGTTDHAVQLVSQFLQDVKIL